ncbi:hypothetical protein ACOSP7_007187 [Xanthoceras sorbifolium]
MHLVLLLSSFASMSKSLNFNLPMKLNKDNYISWKAQVLPAIRALELGDLISGAKAPPKLIRVQSSTEIGTEFTVNKSYTAWMKADQLLLCWLFSTISQDIVGQVVVSLTSFELRNTLENTYSKHSMARVLQLKQKLQNVKKGSSAISEFFIQIKSLSDSLKAAGHVVIECDLMLSVLNGLGHEYDPVVVLISNEQKTMSFHYAQYLLMMHEQRIEQLNSTTQLEVQSASANYAVYDSNDKRFQRGGYNNGRGSNSQCRGRSRGGWWNNNNNRPPCQICRREGHSAYKCYNRFDRNFQQSVNNQNSTFGAPSPPAGYNPNQAHLVQNTAYFASPETVSDPSWHADTGATNHVTNSVGNLFAHSEYHGNERLAVGNGQQLQISHTGNTVLTSPSFHSKSLILKNILCVPLITKNLLNISKFTADNNTFAKFFHDCCVLKDKSTKIVLLKGVIKNRLYRLDLNCMLPSYHSANTATSIESCNVSVSPANKPSPCFSSFVNSVIPGQFCNQQTVYTLHSC